LYTRRLLNKTATKWNYVVLVDQTKRMAVQSARADTVDALKNYYAPLLKKSGAIPVIVDTHSFWSQNTNMSGLEDVATFQKLIYDGVDEYVSALSSYLPRKQSPIVAPIGMAYLTIFEERPQMWVQLFLDDAVHSSLHGSYLFSIVLYATMFRHLPSEEASIPEHIDSLFANSRRLVYGQKESLYYRNVARRVVLSGHVPKSFSR
jgi:hypothetical protein